MNLNKLIITVILSEETESTEMNYNFKGGNNNHKGFVLCSLSHNNEISQSRASIGQRSRKRSILIS